MSCEAVTIRDCTLYRGDCAEVLQTLAAASIDACVTDPPYGMSFMGKRWDYDVPSVGIWSECLRSLKPGGHLLAFAGTRTQHRMAVRIEDAGFEIRDMIAWVYGSGFPKSKNLDGDWQGWGTALKPAMEPITVARKPLIGTVAENVLQHGPGALNIDGCRIPVSDEQYARNCSGDRGHDANRTRGMDFGMTAGKASAGGRWPANLIHDGSDEVVGLFPQSAGQLAPVRPDSSQKTNGILGKFSANNNAEPRGDSGSAARFFYCAKASKRDRDEGNNHPTVKPTDLMVYLCRLVTPPGGIVLDPFMGSGTTGKACARLGVRFVGVERESRYFDIACRRIEHEYERLEKQTEQRELFEVA